MSLNRYVTERICIKKHLSPFKFKTFEMVQNAYVAV